MQHEAWFFVGLFLFIFLIWIAAGGPTRSLSFNGPMTTSSSGTSTPSAGGTYFSLPRAPFAIGDSNTLLSGSSNGESQSPYESFGTTPPPLQGVPFGTVSPYRGIISMSGYVSNASSSDPRSEYVQISVAAGAAESVNLSGWALVSAATGRRTVVPQGTAVPTSGVVNPAQDIVLQRGESAIIVSGTSPVGASFRENKCIGYFSTFQTFSPSLPQNCPPASSELSRVYGTSYIHDPTCIDYVDTLLTCRTPTRESANLSGTCQSFVVKYLNYNGCVAAHKNDADFNGSTWRIYLGRTTPLWRASHEVVKLLDRQGNTVDAFTY